MGYVKDIELKGSDPRAATCRGKLQNRRCRLNQEINKELRLRAGAENLFKATTNRKLKDTVALELSFVNSNLQLLKEQLAELNSSVEIYQNERHSNLMPMIPLGLKETKEINLIDPFSDFILEHYSEEPSIYSDAVADITDTRQAARTPSRDPQGVSLLFRYYNLLYFVERRFFPPDRNLGIYFEWYDSLTGVPSCQRTVAFEKACILFNLGAVYTQIGAKHDRTTEKGLDSAVDGFLRAAGIFRHIYDTFTNAPSMDLKPLVLDVLVSLMLAQARECLFEKLEFQLKSSDVKSLNMSYRELSGEAAQLTSEYLEMHRSIQTNDTHTYLPECWAGLVPLKAEYYKALSHHYIAKCIEIGDKLNLPVQEVQNIDLFIINDFVIEDSHSACALKRAHMKESLASHEEAQRLQRMCRYLKNKTALIQVLKDAYYKTREDYEKFIEEKNEKDIDEDFDLMEVNVEPSSKFTITLTGPDFTSYRVDDPFKRLGPIAIFSARRYWTAPRCVRLQRGTIRKEVKIESDCDCKSSSITRANDTQICSKCMAMAEIAKEDNTESFESFGFHIRGDAPVIISHVDINSLADVSVHIYHWETEEYMQHYVFVFNQPVAKIHHSIFGMPPTCKKISTNVCFQLGGIKEGDFLVEVSGVDVKWYTHQQVVRLIHAAGVSMELKVITPMDRNYLKPLSSNGSISTLSATSSSGVSSGSSSPTGTTSKSKLRSKSSKGRFGTLSSNGWNPFRRTHSLGKIF